MKRKTLAIAAISTVIGTASSSAATVFGSADFDLIGTLQGDFEAGTPVSTWSAGQPNTNRSGAGGASGSQRVNAPVWGFALPTIPVGETIDTVFFGFTMAATAINSGTTHTAVISLMNYDALTDFTAADYTNSAASLGNGTLVGTFNNTDVANNSVESFELTGAALTLFKSFYTGNTPNQADVFFRISVDGGWAYPAQSQDRYQFAQAAGDLNPVRSLTINTVPEPSAALLGLIGTLGLLRRRR